MIFWLFNSNIHYYAKCRKGYGIYPAGSEYFELVASNASWPYLPTIVTRIHQSTDRTLLKRIEQNRRKIGGFARGLDRRGICISQ